MEFCDIFGAKGGATYKGREGCFYWEGKGLSEGMEGCFIKKGTMRLSLYKKASVLYGGVRLSTFFEENLRNQGCDALFTIKFIEKPFFPRIAFLIFFR